MFFKDKDEKIGHTVVSVPCTCTTHTMNISYYKDCNEYYLSFFVDSFYMQDGIFKTIAKRIKRAFLILCGKSYRIEEICLQKEDLERLEKEIHLMLKDNREEK